MDFGLEQEMYIDPQIIEMREKKKAENGKRMNARKKAKERECAIFVAWVFLFAMRYLKLIILDRKIPLNKWFYYETAYAIEDAVSYVVLVLNIVVFIVCLYDFIKIGEAAEISHMLLVVASWIFFRPIYMIMRGVALDDQNAIIKGGVWCCVYGLILCYYAVWYIEVVVTMFASCG